MALKKPSLKFVTLTSNEKEEIRRLTQLANRRIKAAMKKYEEQGLTIAPADVTGGIQKREQWISDKYAISRSVQFKSMADYKDKLSFLKSFDPKSTKQARPTIIEYGNVQQKKLIKAIEKVAMGDLREDLIKKISKMDSAELSKFWKGFSLIGSKLALDYSSEALIAYASEYFKEDVDNFLEEVS